MPTRPTGASATVGSALLAQRHGFVVHHLPSPESDRVRSSAVAAGLLLVCLAVGQADAQTGGPVIAADPTSGSAPLAVGFRVSPPPAGATVDFGDGTTGSLHPAPVCAICPSLATAGHVYQRPGSYVARLLANGQPISGATVMVRAN
jgi:hypothetical protein